MHFGSATCTALITLMCFQAPSPTQCFFRRRHAPPSPPPFVIHLHFVFFSFTHAQRGGPFYARAPKIHHHWKLCLRAQHTQTLPAVNAVRTHTHAHAQCARALVCVFGAARAGRALWSATQSPRAPLISLNVSRAARARRDTQNFRRRRRVSAGAPPTTHLLRAMRAFYTFPNVSSFCFSLHYFSLTHTTKKHMRTYCHAHPHAGLGRPAGPNGGARCAFLKKLPALTACHPLSSSKHCTSPASLLDASSLLRSLSLSFHLCRKV